MAGTESQDWRPWHVLSATILSVDHRCADLLRLIIANEIITSELLLQIQYRDQLFAVRKDEKKPKAKEKEDANKEPDTKELKIKVLQDEYKAICKAAEEEELRLADIEDLDRPFVINLCKNDDRFESFIEGEESYEEQEFGRLCEEVVYFNALRDRAVKRRQWDLKHSRTDKLIEIMKIQEITVAQLMQIIKGEEKFFKKNKKVMPKIELTFQEESSDLINEINAAFELEKQDLARKVLDDSKYEDFKRCDSIPTTIYGLEDSSRKKEGKEEIYNTPHVWLDEILEYRNELVNPTADEIALEKLYEREENITRLSHPYVQFLRYVNFKNYFPSDMLRKKKVRRLLNPIATGAEIELVLNNYKDLLEKLNIKDQKILDLEDDVSKLNRTIATQSQSPKESREELEQTVQNLSKHVADLKKTNDTLRQVIEDRDDLKRISDRLIGRKIRQTLEAMISYGGDRPDIVRVGLNRLHTITMRMEEESEMSNLLWETLMSSW